MKTRIFLAGMMAAVLLSSCSQDEVIEALDMNHAIGFSTYVGKQTKGTITDDSGTTGIQTTGFGVLASYTGQSDFSNQIPNFMYNQRVFYNSGWTYSPLKYWPPTGGDQISFFAYAPYDDANNDKGIVLSGNDKDTDGAPTITFTVNEDPTKMVDFVADVQMNQRYFGDDGNGTDQDTDGVNESEVKFIFKHELTRVSFNAKVDERIALSANTSSSPTRVVIKDVQLKGDNTTNVFYKSATYTFASTNENDVRGTWSYTNATLQSSKYPLSSVLNKENNNYLKGSNNAYLTIVEKF
ncbi:MAG: fimbrillin family protein, partial [Parabacteroides sp.]|nr:fimbrillin family protein [Parabacteroides sp.]